MLLVCSAIYDDERLEAAWDDAVKQAIDETGLYEFPERPTWSPKQVLAPGFLPD